MGNEYKDIKNEFSKGYMSELNEHILTMVKNFGYTNDNLDNLKQWLEDNQKMIKMCKAKDEDGLITRVVFLEDKKTLYTYSLFHVIIKENDWGVMYKFYDVIINE